MRFPDFHAAKREEVPDYTRAAYLQADADNARAQEERLRKQQYWANLEAMGTGAMNVATMNIGDGKTPIGEALRYGKGKYTEYKNTQNPALNPDGSPKLGGRQAMPAGNPNSKDVLMSGDYMPNNIDVKSAMNKPVPGPENYGRSPQPSAVADVLREGPAPKPAMPDFLQNSGLSPKAAMANTPLTSQRPIGDPGQVGGFNIPKGQPPAPAPTPAPAPAPINPGGNGMPGPNSIPTGPQAATQVPIDKMIGMQMEGVGSDLVSQAGGKAAAGMTAQVGGKTAESAISGAAAPALAGGAGDAIGKGIGGAFSAAGSAGAIVPGAGAAMGAIPAALRGDTVGAIKGGVGGAAGSTLMAAGPAMAAAGPVGWAGMAGLAALSLYGMFG